MTIWWLVCAAAFLVGVALGAFLFARYGVVRVLATMTIADLRDLAGKVEAHRPARTETS